MEISLSACSASTEEMPAFRSLGKEDPDPAGRRPLNEVLGAEFVARLSSEDSELRLAAEQLLQPLA